MGDAPTPRSDCQVFGILNVTPDSFSDGGRYLDHSAACQRGLEMLEQGADVIDVGPEASSFHRPGVAAIDASEQIGRCQPIIAELAKAGTVSIDTRVARVAEAAIDAGATIINDITAGTHDPDMLALAAERGVDLVLMHRQDEPPGSTPVYDDVVTEVCAYLTHRLKAAAAAGVSRDRIWLDPGLGFGKTVEHNLALLHAMHRIVALGGRVLIGASRKRFVGAISGQPEAALRVGGSVAVALYAAQRGAAAVRVHDVAITVEAIRARQRLDDPRQ